MNFGSPLFLIGLSAAALPILIHLLTRDRIRRVAFPTLRFFSGASRHVLRRKKFREAILLVLRSLACALLAVAFARPLLSAEGVGRARTAMFRDVGRSFFLLMTYVPSSFLNVNPCGSSNCLRAVSKVTPFSDAVTFPCTPGSITKFTPVIFCRAEALSLPQLQATTMGSFIEDAPARDPEVTERAGEVGGVGRRGELRNNRWWNRRSGT